MDLPNVLGSFLGFLGGAGATALVLRLLAKRAIEHLFDKKLAEFTEAERAKYAQELEHLRAQLDLANFMRQTRFAGLYERQMQGLTELYDKLSELRAWGQFLIASGETIGDEQYTQARSVAWQVSRLIDRHEILFDEDLTSQIREYQQQLLKGIPPMAPVHSVPATTEADRMKRRAYAAVWQVKSAALQRKLKAKFRQIIGLLEADRQPEAES